MRSIALWLTALVLILAVSVVGLAGTTAASGSQTTAAKKKAAKRLCEEEDGAVNVSLTLAPNGSFSGSTTSLSGPADAAGQFTSATQVNMVVGARDVQGGNSAADLCNGSARISGTLTKK